MEEAGEEEQEESTPPRRSLFPLLSGTKWLRLVRDWRASLGWWCASNKAGDAATGPGYFWALSSVPTSSHAKLQLDGCPAIPGTCSALLPFFTCEYSSLCMEYFLPLSSTQQTPHQLSKPSSDVNSHRKLCAPPYSAFSSVTRNPDELQRSLFLCVWWWGNMPAGIWLPIALQWCAMVTSKALGLLPSTASGLTPCTPWSSLGSRGTGYPTVLPNLRHGLLHLLFPLPGTPSHQHVCLTFSLLAGLCLKVICPWSPSLITGFKRAPLSSPQPS